MPSNTTILLLLLFIFAFCLTENGVYAFGAGNIPSFAYLEGKAFRHGDIEDVLEELAKKAAGGFALGTLLGKGSKFNGLDIKRVYFGNWLRDYSQAMDIAAFKKMPQQTILNLIMVLGFMANGYATHEFEVTFERLGVYLPVEHIDNPKGYGEGEDARKYHPSLRPPVNPQELEVDMSTGMKNYIANDRGNWDTSKAHVRRVLEKCVHHGRLHRSKGLKQDEYEAYRLLGTALHTLEDFTAHSNWCELVLVQMGFRDVFLHVGDQVRIQAPNGKWVAPIVTGTFGSNDFFHSLLGEAGDHLSQASVSDLNKALSSARSASSTSRSGPGGGPSDPGDILRGLFSAIPGGAGGDMLRDMEGVERIRAAGSGGFGGGYGSRAGPGPGVAGQPVPGGGKKPEDMTPQELHAVLWQVLTFRDSVVKKISKTIEKIPGLGPLIDKLMDAISVFIFTTLEPFLKPILQTTTSGLHAVSGEVIDSHDQYEVFNDPRASDPTHSFLSKDHFNLILNEPAGRVAQVVVRNAVISVIKAWDDNSVNVNHMTEEILQAMFHPEWHNPQSKVQREMLTNMHDWVNGLGHRKNETISRLSKGPVREHKNIRLAGDGGKPASEGSFASQQGHQASQAALGYVGQIPGVGGTIQGILGGGHGGGTGRDGGGGAAASFFNDGPTSPGGYAPPSGPPPGHGGHSHGGYAPPSGPPPGSGGSSYAPPSGPPPSFPGGGGPGSYHPAHPPTTSPYGAPPIMSASSSMSSDAPAPPAHAGYAPSYSSPPPSFPGGSPGFPGANPSGGPPSFPGASPGFPGADTSYGGGGYGPPGGYGAQPGPPPGHHGGPDFPSGMGFPGAQQQHHGHGHHHQGGPPGFPGAPGGW